MYVCMCSDGASRESDGAGSSRNIFGSRERIAVAIPRLYGAHFCSLHINILLLILYIAQEYYPSLSS